MERKEFLLKMGVGTAALTCNCFWGCSQDNPTGPPAPPQNVDFTVNLEAPENNALKNNGGSIYKNGILVGRVDADTFVAVSQVCTHQGTTVQFQLSSNRIHCPNHGSNYNLNGGVINGPATSPLMRYNTSLEGNTLRIFS